ncbi:hypothetical protein K437DRAFT_6325 [Tilletiaria anomala UBC 951]|uniref:DUF4203 domain-containing protein n=1 Tax=Tilletiaria anomala (strain ATCC 24038 / CBS 436.72 / UBC 951) TaxID=1037660 RepID=A0A066WET5_TILAU|nr:uncharacterized protein K437DRAFT_6325 [Tilletiaria anomala UBC 951]KDN52452.1 hypothetical protein K437DRAFT_6325 [Tilletiaria anomala UBC 951]
MAHPLHGIAPMAATIGFDAPPDSTSSSPVTPATPAGIIAGQESKNLLAGNVPLFMNGHSSSDIADVLVAHYTRIVNVGNEYAALPASERMYAGHDSADLANALVKYVKVHPTEGVPRSVKLAISPNAIQGEGMIGSNAWTTWGLRNAVAVPANADGSYTIDGHTFHDAPFSFANTVQSLYWAQIIYCILWILTGTLLLFSGFASFNWLSRAGVRSRSAILPNGKQVKSRAALLAGGIGGCVIGFLFFSFLVTLVLCAVCARSGKAPLAPQAFFALWFAPSLVLGPLLGGHWRVVGRSMAGLLAGVCTVLLVTAVFGIHTLTIRVILLAIFASLFTAPLLLTARNSTVQRHLLGVCTALIGVVTMLTGVALFAPPEDSSAAWLDLWALLFAHDGSATQANAISAWGTPAFKGYIAGGVLGCVIGCALQFFIGAKTGNDAVEEWNDYLGGWTERFVNKSGAAVPGPTGMVESRAGLFEPAPTAWQRVAGLFSDKDQRPASYGRDPPITAGATSAPSAGGAAFTELNPNRRAKSAKARSSAGRNISRGPARFQALARGEKDAEASELSDEHDADDSDDDSYATNIDDSSVDDKKQQQQHKSGERDAVAELNKGNGGLENYRGYALPRPPSYRTDSCASSAGGNGGAGSGLSGTTKASSSSSSDGLSDPSNSGGSEEVHKPLAVYRDSAAVAAPATLPASSAASRPPLSAPSVAPQLQAPQPAGAQTMVPATPSLINAITRIQQAQAQAQAWKESQSLAAKSGENFAPYGMAKIAPSSPTYPKASTASAPAAGNSTGAGFEKWWEKEVAGKK